MSKSRAAEERPSDLAVAHVVSDDAPGIEGGGNGRFAALLARIDQLRKPGLGRSTITASAWSAGGYAIQTGLRFVSRLILAKLVLDASPMGDVAIVSVILTGLEMISDLGIGFNIVQHEKAEDHRYLGTAFSVQVIRGIIIWAVASALSPLVAHIYHEPKLTGLLLFAASASLLKAFANPGVWTFTRRMQLRTPTLLMVITEIAGFAVTVTWAMISPTAWAIVAGSVAASLASTIASHLVARSPGFVWDRGMARDIIHFGGWMVLSSGTYFLSSRGETLMLRGPVPPVEFGCFAFASMLVTTPVAAVTQLASQVFFPMLASAVRDNQAAAEKQFKRGKWVFTGLAICFAWGSFFVAPPLIGLMHLKSSFAGLYWMVPLLGLRAALDIYFAPTSTVLFAAGASRYSAWVNLVRLVALVAGLYLTVGRWGLAGAIWVLVFAPAISYLALIPGLRRHMPRALGTEFLNLAAFWGAAGLAMAIHYLL